MPRRAGFTLLEICLAIVIGIILLSMAVPSIHGLFQRRELERSFADFDRLVRRARQHALQERVSCSLFWEKQALVLRDAEYGGREIARLELPKDEVYALDLPAALVKKPEPIWTFWPTGSCEPAKVVFRSQSLTWVATYDPLTVRATLEEAK